MHYRQDRFGDNSAFQRLTYVVCLSLRPRDRGAGSEADGVQERSRLAVQHLARQSRGRRPRDVLLDHERGKETQPCDRRNAARIRHEPFPSVHLRRAWLDATPDAGRTAGRAVALVITRPLQRAGYRATAYKYRDGVGVSRAAIDETWCERCPRADRPSSWSCPCSGLLPASRRAIGFLRFFPCREKYVQYCPPSREILHVDILGQIVQSCTHG